MNIFVLDLNVHDHYDPDEVPVGEPLWYQAYGPFATEGEAVDWANRNLQFFGTFEAPLEDIRDADITGELIQRG
jgi:hypothetical protein